MSVTYPQVAAGGDSAIYHATALTSTMETIEYPQRSVVSPFMHLTTDHCEWNAAFTLSSRCYNLAPLRLHNHHPFRTIPGILVDHHSIYIHRDSRRTCTADLPWLRSAWALSDTFPNTFHQLSNLVAYYHNPRAGV